MRLAYILPLFFITITYGQQELKSLYEQRYAGENDSVVSITGEDQFINVTYSSKEYPENFDFQMGLYIQNDDTFAIVIAGSEPCEVESCGTVAKTWKLDGQKWNRAPLFPFTQDNSLFEFIHQRGYFHSIKQEYTFKGGFQMVFLDYTTIEVGYLDKRLRSNGHSTEITYQVTFNYIDSKWIADSTGSSEIDDVTWGKSRNDYDHQGQVIDDNGYVNVRDKPSLATSEVIDVIYYTESFYYNVNPNSEWYAVQLKTGSQGFVHSSSILKD